MYEEIFVLNTRPQLPYQSVTDCNWNRTNTIIYLCKFVIQLHACYEKLSNRCWPLETLLTPKFKSWKIHWIPDFCTIQPSPSHNCDTRMTVTSFYLRLLPPPCWRYTMLKPQRNVINSRLLADCCMRNYTLVEIHCLRQGFRLLTRPLFRLHMPPTWRLSRNDVRASHAWFDPWDIAASQSGRSLYVLEGRFQVLRLDLSGKIETSWSLAGDQCAVSVSRSNSVIVTYTNRVDEVTTGSATLTQLQSDLSRPRWRHRDAVNDVISHCRCYIIPESRRTGH